MPTSGYFAFLIEYAGAGVGVQRAEALTFLIKELCMHLVELDGRELPPKDDLGTRQPAEEAVGLEDKLAYFSREAVMRGGVPQQRALQIGEGLQIGVGSTYEARQLTRVSAGVMHVHSIRMRTLHFVGTRTAFQGSQHVIHLQTLAPSLPARAPR